MLPDAARMGTNIAELQQLLAKKDVRIRELEVENMTLRSQLDKYHSVFQLGDGKRSPYSQLENNISSQSFLTKP